MKDFISPVIANRFPNFVRSEYPAFDKFLQDYLAWLEADEGFLQIINDWKRNTEPSLNVEPYIDAILRDCGFIFEREITIPKSTLLHFLRDFYLSRGSVQSFKFLFKLLFDDNVEIEYPRDHLLWLSSALYGERHYIFLRSTHTGTREYESILGNVSEYAGTLYGSQSQITSFVEGIQPILFNGGEYLKVEVQRPQGEYLPTDLMTLTVNEVSISEQIMSIVGLEIQNPGVGYLPGDQIFISGADVVGTAQVSNTRKDGITGITIVDPGCNYKVGDLILARPGFGGSGFTAQVSQVGSVPVPGQPNLKDAIISCSILSEGYEYESVPEIFAKRPTESMIFDARFEDSQRENELAKPETTTKSKIKDPGISSNVEIENPATMGKKKITQAPPELGVIQPPVLTKIKPCVAKLLATSTKIGQIKNVSFGAPFLGFDDPSEISVQIISEHGSGATFVVKPLTRYSVSAWEDNKGFIGEKTILLDSNKYQQFSYVIRSKVDPSRYQDIVSDLLHPVGYVRSAVVEIEDQSALPVFAGQAQISIPKVLEFNEIYEEIEPLEFSVEIDLGLGINIAVSGGHILVTDTGDEVIL